MGRIERTSATAKASRAEQERLLTSRRVEHRETPKPAGLRRKPQVGYWFRECVRERHVERERERCRERERERCRERERESKRERERLLISGRVEHQESRSPAGLRTKPQVGFWFRECVSERDM
ncbi:MAG: hypothetical protein GY799_23270 [Desulfobulbaceae bacterium]|nr:hypothetical protein [Desulfobulbaceae bacterium]